MEAKNKTIWLLWSFVCLFLLTFSGILYAQKAEAPKPQYGGVIRIIQTTGPKTPFGWPPESIGECSIPARPILEPLVRDMWGGEYEPRLAEAWKVAPDKSSITFFLRRGVKFHDGTELNAQAVKFNLDAQKEAKRATTVDWGDIQVIDDYTLKVNLKTYSCVALKNFAGTGGSIVSPSSYKKHGLDFIRWNPIGTGPFEFVSFERDVSVKTKRFNGYWDKGKPYLDGIEYLFISDPMTQRAAMEAKEADILIAKNIKIAAELRDMGFKAVSGTTGTVVLVPDSANPSSPLSDKRVREAIEYAIDKEAIVKAKGYGFLEAQYQLPLKGTIGYIKNFKGRIYNLEKAKALLKEAGYEKGMKLKIIPYVGLDRDLLVILQNQLKKINIELDIELVDMGKFTDYRRKGWNNGFLCMPQAMENFIWGVNHHYGAISRDFPSLKKPDGFLSILNDALSTVKPQPQKVERVTRLIFDDVMIIPIHTQVEIYVTKPNIMDTGFFKYERFFDWTHERAWIKK